MLLELSLKLTSSLLSTLRFTFLIFSIWTKRVTGSATFSPGLTTLGAVASIIRGSFTGTLVSVNP